MKPTQINITKPVKKIYKKKVKFRDYAGLLYISPWIIGCLLFTAYPFITSIYYSFNSFSILKKPEFVGLQNYIDIFTKDPLALFSLKVTFTYLMLSLPAKLCFALLVAVILNKKIKGISFFRTIYYLPSILGGSVAVAVLWRFLFRHDGIINKVIGIVHVRPLDWLGDPSIALFTLSLLSVWQFGSSMVIFLAALKQIPEELYEAATVDGSSKFKSFFKITIPLITPTIFFNLVMQMINSFQDFTSAFVITNGGPVNSTYVYAMLLYDNAFKYFRMGYASALSWVLFVIILIFTLIVFKSSAYWTYYEDGGEF